MNHDTGVYVCALGAFISMLGFLAWIWNLEHKEKMERMKNERANRLSIVPPPRSPVKGERMKIEVKP